MNPILVTGAGGGRQGSTGKRVTELLIGSGLPVRAFVHKLDKRSDELRKLGAEVVQGDLLDSAAVGRALEGVRRAYFTYPVAEGLLEATTIFASAAREAGIELIVNLSQFQDTPEAPSFRNLQHRLADQIFDWAQVGAVHLQAPPFFEALRALIAESVANKDAMFLPLGGGDAVIPMVAAKDVAGAAAALLEQPTRSENRYDLAAAIRTVNEIAHTLADVLGRPIRYIAVSDEDWKLAARDWLDPFTLDHLSHLLHFLGTSGIGRGQGGYRISGWIRSLTGRTPESLEDFLRANAGIFGDHRQTA